MDWLIPTGPAGQRTNEQLVYAARSIEAVDDHAFLVTSGSAYEGFDPDLHLPRPSAAVGSHKGDQRMDSRRNQIRALPRLGEWFWLSHDDIYLLGEPVTATEYSRSMVEEFERRARFAPRANYVMQIHQTILWLARHGIREPLWFGLHKPLWMNRDYTIDVYRKIYRDFDVLPRSIYCNLALRDGMLELGNQVADVKDFVGLMNEEPDDWCISSSDASWVSGIKDWTARRWPQPSRWEPPKPPVVVRGRFVPPPAL
jgi:hypothetical protein